MSDGGENEQTSMLLIVGGILGVIGLIFKFLQDNPIIFLAVLVGAGYIAYRYRMRNEVTEETYTPQVEPEWDMRYGFTLDTHEIINGLPYQVKITVPARGIYINGTTGVGKTESVARPIIYQAIEKGFSGILYDYKFPQLTQNVRDAFVKSNKSLKGFVCVNFDDLGKTNRVNPFDPALMTDSSHAYEYASSLLLNLNPEYIKEPSFWSRSAEAYLAAVIWFLREEHPDKCTLPHVVNILLNPAADVIEMLSNNLETHDMVSSIREAILEKAGNQKAGVVSTIQLSLSRINNPRVAYVLSGNDFSVDLNNPNAPKFLCIGNDGEGRYNAVISLIISAALKQMNKPNKRHSVLMLDEAPTIFIPKLEKIPAVARENKVSTIFFAQDFKQTEDGYGKVKADVIRSVLNNQIYMQVADYETAKYISNIWGKEDRWIESRSTSTGESEKNTDWFEKSNSKNESVSYSQQERDRIKPQDVLTSGVGEAFIKLVESDYSYVRLRLKGCKYPKAPTFQAFKTVSDTEAKDTWLRIKQEANTIISSYLKKSPNSKADQSTLSTISDDDVASRLAGI